MKQKVFIDLYSYDCNIHASRDALTNAIIDANFHYTDTDVESYFNEFVVETRLHNIEHIGEDIEKFVAVKTEYGSDGKISGNDAILFALTKNNLSFLFDSFGDEMKNHYSSTFKSLIDDPTASAFIAMIELDDILSSWGVIRDESAPYKVTLHRVLHHA